MPLSRQLGKGMEVKDIEEACRAKIKEILELAGNKKKECADMVVF